MGVLVRHYTLEGVNPNGSLPLFLCSVYQEMVEPGASRYLLMTSDIKTELRLWFRAQRAAGALDKLARRWVNSMLISSLSLPE